MTDGQKILSYLLVAMAFFLGWSNGGNSWICELWKYCNMTVTFLISEIFGNWRFTEFGYSWCSWSTSKETVRYSKETYLWHSWDWEWSHFSAYVMGWRSQWFFLTILNCIWRDCTKYCIIKKHFYELCVI